MTNEFHMLTALQAALRAGEAILEVYHGTFSVTEKADRSPLTEADTRSHAVIVEALRRDLGAPVLSEEGKEISYETRKTWATLWIVDPLDGTKEFIKRNGEFTVNIAWVRDGIPEWGVVYVPDKRMLYFGGEAMGAYRMETIPGESLAMLGAALDASSMDTVMERAERLEPLSARLDQYTIVGSRSHPSEALEAFVTDKQKEYGQVTFVSAGSALKFCLIAEGRAHIYPRLGPTMEWDTAAGHAVAAGAGCNVYRYEDELPLLYNKADLLNPWFVVSSPLTPEPPEAVA